MSVVDLEKYITANEAAKIIKKTSDYVRKLCANGEIEGAIKFGSAWIIPREAIEKFPPKLRGFAIIKKKYLDEQIRLQNQLLEMIKTAKARQAAQESAGKE